MDPMRRGALSATTAGIIQRGRKGTRSPQRTEEVLKLVHACGEANGNNGEDEDGGRGSESPFAQG